MSQCLHTSGNIQSMQFNGQADSLERSSGTASQPGFDQSSVVNSKFSIQLKK